MESTLETEDAVDELARKVMVDASRSVDASLSFRPLRIVDDPLHGILKINGVCYSYEFFEAFGFGGAPVGTRFRIVRRRDKAITVERIEG